MKHACKDTVSSNHPPHLVNALYHLFAVVMEVVKVLYEGVQLVVVPFFPSFSHGGKSSAISTNHEKHIFSTEVTHKNKKHFTYVTEILSIVCSNQRLSKQETATKLHNVLP